MMKILIINLGAKGDVIRTMSILPAIKEKYPYSEIHWLVNQKNSELIKDSPYIDKIYFLEAPPNEKFDILYNFDIEKQATELATKINASKKYGFYEEGGYASAFNLGAEYYLNTLFDDNIKANNTKTYQEMIFETAELPYKKQHHEIFLNDKDRAYAEDFIKEKNIITEKLIGIHIGSSPRWPSKAWSEIKIKEFIREAGKKGYEILLFWGPDEIKKRKKLLEELKKEELNVHISDPENTDKQFASLVEKCKTIVCSDSFALHVSLALKKPTIALFFCTPPNEIEDYGILKKIVSPKLHDFFPEKMNQYSEELVNSISVEQVLKAVEADMGV